VELGIEYYVLAEQFSYNRPICGSLHSLEDVIILLVNATRTSGTLPRPIP
jgi:hypothetical protein